MSNPWDDLVNSGSVDPVNGDLATRQWCWLSGCIERNRETEFGRQFRFGSIDSIDAYRRQVPIQPYEGFADSIERMAQGQPDILFSGKPLAFEYTGGSSGGTKLIPYSKPSLNDFRTALLPWLSRLISCYEISSGSAYWAISPATRRPESTVGGTPVGLPDGAYLGGAAQSAFAAIFAVPDWVGAIEDISDWELATLYWLVRHPDLSLVSVWSPTFFLRLLNGLERRRLALLDLLKHGDSLAAQSLPADRAALGRLQDFYGTGEVKQLWPVLKIVSCWTDASSRPFSEALRAQLPGVAMQGKGLLATEGVTTVPYKEGRPVLAADSGFFEFLDDGGAVHNAWALSRGKCYEVIMTTSGGLYRYRSGDRVRCEGFTEGLPVLVFIGRGDLVSDLVGEKLTEEFVTACLTGLPGFRMLVPVRGDNQHYTLVMDRSHGVQAETLVPAVESRLTMNPQYAFARKMGQLGELTLTLKDNPLDDFLKHASTNQRLGDIKVPSLCPQDQSLIRLMAGTD